MATAAAAGTVAARAAAAVAERMASVDATVEEAMGGVAAERVAVSVG